MLPAVRNCVKSGVAKSLCTTAEASPTIKGYVQDLKARTKQFIPDLQCSSDAFGTSDDLIQDDMACTQANSSADSCKSA